MVNIEMILGATLSRKLDSDFLYFQASSDMSILDFDIPYSISFVVAGSIEVALVIIVMSTVTWQVLIVAIPVIIIMTYVQVSFQFCLIYILVHLLKTKC